MNEKRIIFNPNIISSKYNFKKFNKRRSIKNKPLDEIEKKKRKKIIILSLLAFFGLGIICLIIIILIKHFKKKVIEPLEVTSREPIKIPISQIDYRKAESLFNLEIINNNYHLLNQSIDKINNSLILCQKSNISEMIGKKEYSLPDFLKNPTKNSLKFVKNDLELYMKKYEEISLNINNMTKTASEFIKNLYSPLFNLKKEINSLMYKFEETIANLSITLFYEQEVLNSIKMTKLDKIKEIQFNKDKLSINHKIEIFKNETKKLNNIYNKIFNYVNETIQIINEEIKEILFMIRDIQDQIKEGNSKFEDILKLFKEDDENLHNYLITIKQNFLSIKNDIIKKQSNFEIKINTLENKYKKILEFHFRSLENQYQTNENRFQNFEKENQFSNTYYNEFKNEENEHLEYLETLSNEIINDIIFVGKKYSINSYEIPELKASNIIVDLIAISLDIPVKIIIEEQRLISNGLEVFKSTINVEEKTSLDLMFIMDLTGSMSSYINQAKNNVINIMNKIPIECPGIDINLGFIGYRDVDDIKMGQYTIIDFTKNHSELQNSIKGVYASGGNGDWSEDMNWAFEKALEQSWKNNAKFAILIGDTPCHGTKYHNLSDFYPDGVPGRRNIEELIKELAEKNISLFCMEITNMTKIMFEIFGNIYKNYPNCEYHIIPMNSAENLSNIVVNSAIEVYTFHRNIEN